MRRIKGCCVHGKFRVLKKGDENMQGRPKGGKNKYYSKEEKLKYVKQMLDGRSCWEIERENGINHSLTNNWLKKYNERGIEGLENKKKPGNPLMKYSAKKDLTELEKLEYENMKLRIENERLKKGYLVKGDGSVVVFKK